MLKAITDDGLLSDSCDIAVYDIHPSSVKIDGYNYKVCQINNTLDLTCTVLPENAKDKSVKWSSSDPTIASIDEKTGKVTGIKPGDVVITATTNDGGLSTSCDLTVYNVSISTIYELLKTPYKYGAVLKEDNYFTDSPSVFHYNNKWYMTYITIGKDTQSNGYETWIAESTDLINWTNRTKILERKTESGRWDSHQIAGYIAFMNNSLYGDYELQTVNNKHYIAYLGGKLNGYETDPLSAGEASFTDPMDPSSYQRFDNPILSPKDEHAREGENKTIYKSYMFIDEQKTLGHKYVNFYNAKGNDDVEKIFIAVSDDAETWTRYLDYPVYKDPDAKITGDPIILKFNDTFIMVYYTLKNGKTVDTFAISKNLVNWTPWKGEPLIQSTEPWENTYAHKPSIVYKDDILYHFYCAVNSNNERFIAVATSDALNK